MLRPASTVSGSNLNTLHRILNSSIFLLITGLFCVPYAVRESHSTQLSTLPLATEGHRLGDYQFTSDNAFAGTEQFIALARRFLREMLEEKIKNGHATDQMLQAFDRIDIEIFESSQIGAYADVRDDGSRVIYFSTGTFVSSVLLAIWSSLNTENDIRNTYRLSSPESTHCSQYHLYFADYYNRFKIKPVPSFMHDIMTPYEWCSIPRDGLNISIFEQRLEAFAFPLVLFIIAHEYGHHILQHIPVDKDASPSMIRIYESEADFFASKLVAPMTLTNISPFMFFTSGLQTLDPFDKNRINEPAECRFLSFILRDNIYINSDIVDRLAKKIINDFNMQSFYKDVALLLQNQENERMRESCPSIFFLDDQFSNTVKAIEKIQNQN